LRLPIVSALDDEDDPEYTNEPIEEELEEEYRNDRSVSISSQFTRDEGRRAYEEHVR
jgi:hypothetical protein